MRKKTKSVDDESLRLVLELFLAGGGFGGFLQAPRSAKGLLSCLKKEVNQLRYVYKITEFVARYHAHGADPKKFTIGSAKHFVMSRQVELKFSAISNRWEIHRQGAPYVYAFFQWFSKMIETQSSIDDFVDCIEELCRDEELLTRAMGEAATIADLLQDIGVRNVRAKAFKKMQRTILTTAPFSPAEIELINRIDVDALSEEGAADWKPKQIKKARVD